MQSYLDIAQQEQHKEDDQDQPEEATAPGEGVVAIAVAVAAAQQDDKQDHDKDQYDRTHCSLLKKKEEHAPPEQGQRQGDSLPFYNSELALLLPIDRVRPKQTQKADRVEHLQRSSTRSAYTLTSPRLTAVAVP
jgi:hypothetical protein